EHIERPHRQLPFLFAFGSEGDEAEVLKEGVDVRAVGHGARRGRAVDVLQPALLRARDFALPEYLPGGAVEADDEQFVTLLLLRVRGHEDAVAREDRRRMPRR